VSIRVAVALLSIAVTAGCGSSSGSGVSAPRTGGTLEALAEAHGRPVALTPGGDDFAPGRVRYTFLVIASDGRAVYRPRATVWISRGLKQKPFAHTTATLERITVPGKTSAPFGVDWIYVSHVDVPAPGTYWVLARPQGAPVSGLGNLVAAAHTSSPAIGAAAPRSETPTLATSHNRLAPLTTSTHPDRALYRTSVAQALAAHAPFVVAFATPKFCTSRTCGPVVDVVSSVRRDFARTPLRFIHVEVYEHNDPGLGFNRWMKQWHLQSEPWVFLVGRDGRIKAKFQGSVSPGELRAAIRSTFLKA
jgi:hypothetical protein